MKKVRHTPVALVLWREAYSGDRQQLQGKRYRQAPIEQAAVECVQSTTDKTVNQQAGDIYNYERPSQLTQWPVQIKLAPVNAPYFNGAKLLIAADCTAYAYASFHEKFIKGHVTLIGCPKLDSVDYSEKLTEIIRRNDIQSVTISPYGGSLLWRTGDGCEEGTSGQRQVYPMAGCNNINRWKNS